MRVDGCAELVVIVVVKVLVEGMGVDNGVTVDTVELDTAGALVCGICSN